MNKKGFTLIELLIVIAIIGILTGLIAVGMNEAKLAAQDSKKKATVDSIKKSLVIDRVETGTYPIEAGCTIGFDCGTLDPILQQYLPPDLDGTFIYQSDGNGCTVSTILSNGYVYQYDCLTSTYSSNTPVSGACGSSGGANLVSIPLTNLCNLGTATAVTGNGPWTWSCTGANTGTTASCTANKIINGACGTANKAYAYSATTYGTDTICEAGTANPTSPAFPGLGGSTPWSCTGANTGTTANCSASRAANPISGACGSSHGASLASAPTTGLCNSGTPSAYGSWSWTCLGSNGGTNSGTCSAIYLDLYGNVHSSAQCSAIGGIATNTDDGGTPLGAYFCMMTWTNANKASAACPATWTQQGNGWDTQYFTYYRILCY